MLPFAASCWVKDGGRGRLRLIVIGVRVRVLLKLDNNICYVLLSKGKG